MFAHHDGDLSKPNHSRDTISKTHSFRGDKHGDSPVVLFVLGEEIRTSFEQHWVGTIV